MGGGLRLRFRLAVPFAAAILAFAACHEGDDEPGTDGAGVAPPGAEVIVRAADGVPTYIGGDLGQAPSDLDLADAEVSMQPILAQVAPLFGARANQLRLTRLETDEIGYRPVESPVDVHDLQATILHLLGLDHERLTYRFQGRDFRLTDVHGELVTKLLA